MESIFLLYSDRKFLTKHIGNIHELTLFEKKTQ